MFGEENLTYIKAALGPIWPFCLAVIFDIVAAVCMWAFVLVRGAHDYISDRHDSVSLRRASRINCRQFFIHNAAQLRAGGSRQVDSASSSHNGGTIEETSAESIEMASTTSSGGDRETGQSTQASRV